MHSMDYMARKDLKKEFVAVVKFKCIQNLLFWNSGSFATNLQDFLDLLESFVM